MDSKQTVLPSGMVYKEAEIVAQGIKVVLFPLQHNVQVPVPVHQTFPACYYALTVYAEVLAVLADAQSCFSFLFS